MLRPSVCICLSVVVSFAYVRVGIHLYFVSCSGYRSNNFIVGLTNTYPVLLTSVLWNYTLCGQYPGAVPDGATVTVECTDVTNRRLRFQFVIVQFPLINEPMNFCEIEVFTAGKPVINVKILH